MVRIVEPDGELIATQAADQIARGHQFAQQLCKTHQHLVALGVPQAVVDRLEGIEVNEHQGRRVVVTVKPGDVAADFIHECTPIGQPGYESMLA
jgi:hypothetical protein